MGSIPLERQYTLGEILTILENTPATTHSQDPSTSSRSSISSASDEPSGRTVFPECARQKRNYCTWCGRGGHAKNDCIDLTVAFKLGVIRTRRGKICLINGGKIPWPHGEKCLKDWVLRNGRSESIEIYRRARTAMRQEKKSEV